MAKQASKNKNIFVRHRLAVVAAGTILLVAGSVGVAKRVVSPGEKVVSVIDGDSFKIANDQTIRLLSLNAPEIQYCAGDVAKKALDKKILNKKVILKELKTDRFGRVMAMVYVNGINVNEFMIKNGLGIHLWDTSAQKGVFEKANDFAREHRLGIFSPECYQTEPPKKECSIKGSIVLATKAKEYTMPGCDHYSNVVVEKYRGEDWFCTEKEAKETGYVKSKNCK